jgi:hypothetical protein
MVLVLSHRDFYSDNSMELCCMATVIESTVLFTTSKKKVPC